MTDQYRDGAYNWIGVDAYDNSNPGSPSTPGLSGTVQYNPHIVSGSGSFEVDHWYSTANAYYGIKPLLIGSAYAGFNDTNADWGWASPHTQGRKMARLCGLVWLNSWNRLTADGFSGSKQIPFMGIPTFNDYEEGTAIETGIDNCATLSDDPIPSGGTTYTFHVGFSSGYGTESTIDHYSVYYSTDGTT